jgi:hypothetical protein
MKKWTIADIPSLQGRLAVWDTAEGLTGGAWRVVEPLSAFAGR